MLLMLFAFTALLDLEMTYAISEYILQTLICENFNHYLTSFKSFYVIVQKMNIYFINYCEFHYRR